MTSANLLEQGQQLSQVNNTNVDSAIDATMSTLSIATPPDSPDIAPLDPMPTMAMRAQDHGHARERELHGRSGQGRVAAVGAVSVVIPIPSIGKLKQDTHSHSHSQKQQQHPITVGKHSGQSPRQDASSVDKRPEIAPAADYHGQQAPPAATSPIDTSTTSRQPTAANPIAEIERFIELARYALQIPGIAVSVTQHEQPLIHRAFGSSSSSSSSSLVSSRPMTTSTLTDLCSLTKAFTAAAAAVLVHQGKLDWQTPIVHYVPDMAFSDPLASSAITMLDLLSHRTGLAAHDELWTGHSRSLRANGDLVDAVPGLDFGGHFRASYVFSHIGYAIATLVIERVALMPFEAFVTQTVLEPLGMVGIKWKYPGAKRKLDVGDGVVARPHECVWLSDPLAVHAFRTDVVADFDRFVDDVHPAQVTDGLAHAAEYTLPVQPTSGYVETNRYMAGAAGVMYASADDMAKWAACWLNHGLAPDGKTRVLHEMSVLTRVHNSSDLYESEAEARRGMRVIGYACGWEVNQFGDHEILMHTGGSPGYATLLALIPGANLSIYIAENQSFTSLSSVLLPLLLHTLIPPPSPSSPKSKAIRPFTLADACAALPRVKLNMVLAHARAHLAVAPRPLVDPIAMEDELQLSLDARTMEALVGVYKHDAYGYVTIALNPASSVAAGSPPGLRLMRAPDLNTALYPSRAQEEPGCLTFFTYPTHTLYWFRAARETEEDKYVRQARRGFVDDEDEAALGERFELVMREESAYVEVVFTRVG